jgi:hypothetical protein
MCNNILDGTRELGLKFDPDRTCLDEGSCSEQYCRFLRDGCNQEFWKLLIEEGICVAQYQYSDRHGVTFFSNNLPILHVIINDGCVGIDIVDENMTPPRLLEFLEKSDLNAILRETSTRVLRSMMGF